jgi:hypothetical protein
MFVCCTLYATILVYHAGTKETQSHPIRLARNAADPNPQKEKERDAQHLSNKTPKTSPILFTPDADHFAFAFGVQHQSAELSATNTRGVHAFAPALDAQTAFGVVPIDHYLRLLVFLVAFFRVASKVFGLAFGGSEELANKVLTITVQVAFLCGHNSTWHWSLEFPEPFRRFVPEQAVVVPVPDVSPGFVVPADFFAAFAGAVGGWDVRFGVEGAHVGYVVGVLLFEWDGWYQAGVYDDDGLGDWRGGGSGWFAGLG